MKNRIIYPLISFILIFLIHGLYSLWQIHQLAKQWVQINNVFLLSLYFSRQDYFLSFSFALTGSFTVYAILKFIENRRNGISGIAGGITWTGILSVGICFLSGCCGSPMLAVYLAFFGSSLVGFTQPLAAIITTISVIVGYIWINRSSKAVCSSDKDCNCSTGIDTIK